MIRSVNTHNFLYITGMIWLLVLAAPTSVRAHEGEAGIDLAQNQLTPGSLLQIEGFNLGADLTVTIILEKDTQRILIGQTVADDHGDFLAEFYLPQNLPAGLYTVTAIDQRIPTAEIFLATSTLRVEEPHTGAWLNTAVPLIGTGLFLLILGLVYLLRRRKNA